MKVRGNRQELWEQNVQFWEYNGSAFIKRCRLSGAIKLLFRILFFFNQNVENWVNNHQMFSFLTFKKWGILERTPVTQLVSKNEADILKNAWVSPCFAILNVKKATSHIIPCNFCIFDIFILYPIWAVQKVFNKRSFHILYEYLTKKNMHRSTQPQNLYFDLVTSDDLDLTRCHQRLWMVLRRVASVLPFH